MAAERLGEFGLKVALLPLWFSGITLGWTQILYLV